MPKVIRSLASLRGAKDSTSLRSGTRTDRALARANRKKNIICNGSNHREVTWLRILVAIDQELVEEIEFVSVPPLLHFLWEII